MSGAADRAPVIVGVGQVNDRPADDAAGLDSFQLMLAALRRAAADATANGGGGGWLDRADSLAVVRQIAFPGLGDLSAGLAGALGLTPRFLHQTPQPTGESPVRLLNEAANRIAAGEAEIALVVGGEALRTAARRAAAAAAGGPPPDAMADLAGRGPPSPRKRYGLVAPVDVYPLYENACRAAWGQSFAEARSETGEIWARLAAVAAENEHAWLQRGASAEEVVAPSSANRPIAWPYLKLMVANAGVNQAAAVIVTSAARARAAGMAEDRLVFVGPGAAAHEADEPLDRPDFARSAGMEVSLRRALQLNGLTTADLDLVELYSCFPCVPKMARRVIGWPAERPASVFGGLTFGGGPIGNYMTHAIASMTDALRVGKGRRGLLFANGGYATHNHSLVLRRDPPTPGAFPQDFDCQREAEALRGPAPPFRDDYAGPGTVETCTVLFDRAGAPRFGAVVGRSPAGERFLARVPASDEAGLAMLMDEAREPVGTPGVAERADGLTLWRTTPPPT